MRYDKTLIQLYYLFVCLLILDFLNRDQYWQQIIYLDKISVSTSIRWFGLSSLIGNDIKLSRIGSSIWSNQTRFETVRVKYIFCIILAGNRKIWMVLTYSWVSIKLPLNKLLLWSRWQWYTGVDKHFIRTNGFHDIW